MEGSFIFTVLDEKENLYFVKGDSPSLLSPLRRVSVCVHGGNSEPGTGTFESADWQAGADHAGLRGHSEAHTLRAAGDGVL